MKLLLKIFLVFLIIFVSYILLVLSGSSFWDTLWKSLWLENFNAYIKGLKWELDKKSTSDFYEKNLKWVVDSTLSWAEDIWNNVVGWLNEVKNTIDDTRQTINTWIEWYKSVKKRAEDATKALNNSVRKIWEASSEVQKLRNNIK